MVATLSQTGFTGRLATSLGKDFLVLGRIDAFEGLGELFEYRIEALSETPNIDFDQALGKETSVHLDTVDNVGRDFSGILTEARWIGMRGNYFLYRLVLRPWLWLLSITSDSRIFSQMSPDKIIFEVFKDRGFSEYSNMISKDYPKLEYCVQYRETDLNFVLRLMEQYGIYYYFKFTSGDGDTPSTHQLVVADSDSHENLPGLTTVNYTGATVASNQRFTEWEVDQTIVSGVYTLKDYNYESPSAAMTSTATYPYKFTHGAMEVFDYPGNYEKRADGDKLAAVERDTQRTRNARFLAGGYAPSLMPGFSITRASTVSYDSGNDQFVVLRCTHAYGYQDYETVGANTDHGAYYIGTYEFAHVDVPFRMPLKTRKPVIVGAQSALVVGKEGEEIDVDKEGRICVQFYWDRKEKASRRIRVAQFWAGSHRGALFLPRIGDEVMVQFENGDPDRPVVVGSVYNGKNTVPADLPTKKTYSGVLTKSSKNSSGYNMFLLDDTAGKERVKLRSQRDLMFKARRNEQRDILGSQTENVGGDITQTVSGDFKISVGVQDPPSGGHYSLTATQSIVLGVGLESTITITEDSITLQSPMIYLNP